MVIEVKAYNGFWRAGRAIAREVARAGSREESPDSAGSVLANGQGVPVKAGFTESATENIPSWIRFGESKDKGEKVR